MNILFVTPTPPFPPRDGAQLMMANLARGLEARHALTLVTLATTPPENAPQPYFRTVHIFPRRTAPRWRKWAYSLVDRLPALVRGYESAELRAALSEIAARERIEIVHLDTAMMAQYADALGAVPAVAAPHDAMTLFLQERARNAPDRLLRLLTRAQVSKMRDYERRYYARAARVCVVTERECDALKSLAPQLQVRVIPNGVDTDYFAPLARIVPPDTIGFLGAMDYAPNRAAALYFVNEILPHIARELPNVRFTIIGRNPSAEIRALERNPRVRVTGTVEDVRPFVAEQRLMVAPFREAGGIKNKVLETLAMGKALVVTPVAAEGISVRDGHELALARGAEESAAACVKLLGDENLRGALEKNARVWALQHGWEATVAQYEALYQEARDAFAVR